MSLILVSLWSCTDIGAPCSEGLDCEGECGGSAVVDCAGTCNGGAFIVDDNCTNISYSTTIQPILTANCTSCHGGNHSTGLDLSSYTGLMVGSNNGPVIIAGDHVNSLLWQRVDAGEMPPNPDPDLSSNEVSLIAQWINEGAINN